MLICANSDNATVQVLNRCVVNMFTILVCYVCTHLMINTKNIFEMSFVFTVKPKC